jgi:hypothetical protein
MALLPLLSNGSARADKQHCTGEQRLLPHEASFLEWLLPPDDTQARVIRHEETRTADSFFAIVFDRLGRTWDSLTGVSVFTFTENVPTIHLRRYYEESPDFQSNVIEQLLRMKPPKMQKPHPNFFIIRESDDRNGDIAATFRSVFTGEAHVEYDEYAPNDTCRIVRARDGFEIIDTKMVVGDDNSVKDDVACLGPAVMAHYGFSNPVAIYRSGALLDMHKGEYLVGWPHWEIYLLYGAHPNGRSDRWRGIPHGLQRCEVVDLLNRDRQKQH